MHSRSTKNLGLPQWNPEDHPEWIGDMNPAFEKIDTDFGGAVTDIPNMQKELEQLQTITQSQQEDILNLQSEAARLAVRVGNTESETEKIAGLQEQITNVAAEVMVNLEKIQKLQNQINASKALNTAVQRTGLSLTYLDGDKGLTISSVQRFGDIMFIALNSHTPNAFSVLLNNEQYAELLGYVGLEPADVLSYKPIAADNEVTAEGTVPYIVTVHTSPNGTPFRFSCFLFAGGDVNGKSDIILKLCLKEGI